MRYNNRIYLCFLRSPLSCAIYYGCEKILWVNNNTFLVCWYNCDSLLIEQFAPHYCWSLYRWSSGSWWCYDTCVLFIVLCDFKRKEVKYFVRTMRRPYSGPRTSRLRLEDICSTILLPPGFLRLVGLHRRWRQIFGQRPKPFLASGPPR